MTLAELILFAAAASGLYFVFRPIQRRLERYLAEHVFGRGPRSPRRTIDVIHFTSSRSDNDKKDEYQ